MVLIGNDFDEAKRECVRLIKEEGLTNIPPYDDPYVIAGQGTIGMEVLRQHDVNDISAIFIAVGGGGLIAGVGSYVKRIAPHIKIIGVEANDADAMTRSLASKERVELKEVGLFADGAAVRIVGEENFRVASQLIDEVINVSNDEICAAIKDLFEGKLYWMGWIRTSCTDGAVTYVPTKIPDRFVNPQVLYHSLVPKSILHHIQMPRVHTSLSFQVPMSTLIVCVLSVSVLSLVSKPKPFAMSLSPNEKAASCP